MRLSPLDAPWDKLPRESGAGASGLGMLGSHRRVGLRVPCAACADAGCCATTAQATSLL